MALLCAIWISFVMSSILSHQIPLDDVIVLAHNKRNDCMQKKRITVKYLAGNLHAMMES